MVVLVTGVTGFLGRHIAEHALAAGHIVIGLARDEARARPIAELGAVIRKGDLGDPASLRAAAADCEVVFHAAARVGDWAPRREFYEANVGGTRHMLEAAEHAGARRVVYLSSVAVYGRMEDRVIDESHPYVRTGDFYIDTKIEAEQRAWTYAHAAGMELVVLRPSLVYGPYDPKFIPRVARSLRKGRLPLIGGGSHPAPVIYIEDVARLALRAADRREAAGNAFNIVGDEQVSWREFFTELASQIGARPPTQTISRPAALAVATMMEWVWRAAGASEPPLLTRFAVRLMGNRVQYNIEKADRILGLRPRVKAREGLARTVEWLRDSDGTGAGQPSA